MKAILGSVVPFSASVNTNEFRGGMKFIQKTISVGQGVRRSFQFLDVNLKFLNTDQFHGEKYSTLLNQKTIAFFLQTVDTVPKYKLTSYVFWSILDQVGLILKFKPLDVQQNWEFLQMIWPNYQLYPVEDKLSDLSF